MEGKVGGSTWDLSACYLTEHKAALSFGMWRTYGIILSNLQRFSQLQVSPHLCISDLPVLENWNTAGGDVPPSALGVPQNLNPTLSMYLYLLVYSSKYSRNVFSFRFLWCFHTYSSIDLDQRQFGPDQIHCCISQPFQFLFAPHIFCSGPTQLRQPKCSSTSHMRTFTSFIGQMNVLSKLPFDWSDLSCEKLPTKLSK